MQKLATVLRSQLLQHIRCVAGDVDPLHAVAPASTGTSYVLVTATNDRIEGSPARADMASLSVRVVRDVVSSSKDRVALLEAGRRSHVFARPLTRNVQAVA